MPYCTSCGAEADENQTYCERCGALIEALAMVPAPLPSSSPSPGGEQEGHRAQEPSGERACHVGPKAPEDGSATKELATVRVLSPLPAESRKKRTVAIILTAILVPAVLIAATVFIVLPFLNAGQSDGTESTGMTADPVTILQTAEVTARPEPTPTINPYASTALALRTMFSYNEGGTASRASVYRTWMNSTYQWHNDNDNRYYTQRPDAGNKYLFVYVVIINDGSEAYPYPKSRNVYVHYNGNIFSPDTSHYLPKKSGDRDAQPVEILEVMQQHDYFNAEYVEDYGYSHGTMSDFITPGQSNAIDGYIIYEVPESLTLDATYVEIVFDSRNSAVWRLA